MPDPLTPGAGPVVPRTLNDRFGPEKAEQIRTTIRDGIRRKWEDPKYRARHKEGIRKANQRPEVRANRRAKFADAHGNWQGGRVVSGGYVFIYCPEHPRAISEYAREHILVAEYVLGRYLKYLGKNHPENEEVHHTNFDGTDNRPENLLVCTREYHRRLHDRISGYYLEEFFYALRRSA